MVETIGVKEGKGYGWYKHRYDESPKRRGENGWEFSRIYERQQFIDKRPANSKLGRDEKKHEPRHIIEKIPGKKINDRLPSEEYLTFK